MKHFTTLILFSLVLVACGKNTDSDKTISTFPSQTINVANTVCSLEQVGVSFKAADGCNTCSCNSKGVMLCTQIACLYSN